MPIPGGTPPGLISLEDTRAELNQVSTVDDDELQGYIDAASGLLLNHPDYRIADATGITSYTEWVDAGSDTVLLQHYPVVSVTSVTEFSGSSSQVIAAEPLDGGSFTSYGWDYQDGTGANGILVRLSGGSPVRWCGSRVKVVYTAGAASVPAEIRLACLALVDHLWAMQRGGDGGGLPTGDEFTGPDQFGAPLAPAVALPPVVKGLLAAYRRDPLVA